MRVEHSFNFHDLVGFQVVTEAPFAGKYFLAEYGLAAGDIPSGVPSVVLHWTESALPRRPNASYQLKIHKGIARWYYRVSFEPGRILIEAAGNRVAVSMVHHMLVHGCLRYLCSKQEAMLLHAAALAYKKHSLIFAGSGGVGKTTVSSIVLEEGETDWELHADDYVFLTSAGETYSYPSRAHLYADFLKGAPSAADRLSAGQRLHLSVFGAVRKATGQRVKWPLRVEPKSLWPDRMTAPLARMQTLLLLESSQAKDLTFEPVSEPIDILDHLVTVNFYEARHTLDLVGRSNAPSDFPGDWRARERSTLGRALQTASAYRLALPPLTNLDRIELVSKLQHLVSIENGRRIIE